MFTSLNMESIASNFTTNCVCVCAHFFFVPQPFNSHSLLVILHTSLALQQLILHSGFALCFSFDKIQHLTAISIIFWLDIGRLTPGTRRHLVSVVPPVRDRGLSNAVYVYSSSKISRSTVTEKCKTRRKRAGTQSSPRRCTWRYGFALSICVCVEICISVSQTGRNLDRIIRASLIRVCVCDFFFSLSLRVGDAADFIPFCLTFFSVCGGNTWNMTHAYNTIPGKCNLSRLWLILRPRTREENKQIDAGWLQVGARSTPHFKNPGENTFLDATDHQPHYRVFSHTYASHVVSLIAELLRPFFFAKLWDLPDFTLT